MGTGMVLGAVIGYERERTGHPAGLRTHIGFAFAHRVSTSVGAWIALPIAQNGQTSLGRQDP